MQVRELMTRKPKVIPFDSSLKEAAEAMKDIDTGALPVVENGTARGIITDRDITVRAVAEGRDPKSVKVKEAMTPSVVSCRQDDPVDIVIRQMMEHKIRRIVVEDDNGDIAGIVSLGDLALATEDKKLAGEVLRSVSS